MDRDLTVGFVGTLLVLAAPARAQQQQQTERPRPSVTQPSAVQRVIVDKDQIVQKDLATASVQSVVLDSEDRIWQVGWQDADRVRKVAEKPSANDGIVCDARADLHDGFRGQRDSRRDARA